MKKQYTTEEIKKAFFKVFHEGGEFFFPYPNALLNKHIQDVEKRCTEITEYYFLEVLDYLEES